jgi:selenocysteine-specific elongation factor
VPATAAAAIEAVRDHHERRPLEPGIAVGALRAIAATALRRRTDAAEPDVAAAADAFVDATISAGRLVREGDRVRLPEHEVALPPEVDAAMTRLEAALDDPLPPPIAEAARATGCPPEGVRALESAGRIVRLDGEVGFAAAAFERYGRVALDLAAAGPVTPAALRDAIGSSRKYVMALLEELDRRETLRRTPDGHVPGARAAMGLGR